MLRLLLLFLILYLVFRFIRGFFKGIFVITNAVKQQNENQQNPKNYYSYQTNGREKDISDRARILEEDKNAE